MNVGMRLLSDDMYVQAQDMGIEDCLNAVTSALDCGSITIDAYVRNFRLLAEDQYKCRLLGIKIQEQQRAKSPQVSQQTFAGVQLPQGDAWSRTSTYPAYPTP
jgi:hypothetical protein